MSALRDTEFRTLSNRQLQTRMDRAQAAHRAKVTAREAKLRKLPTPNTRPAPVAPDDSPVLTMCLEVLAGLLLWALFGWGVIALIAWWQA